MSNLKVGDLVKWINGTPTDLPKGVQVRVVATFPNGSVEVRLYDGFEFEGVFPASDFEKVEE